MLVPTLDDHPITRGGLHALCTSVLKTKDGEPWDVTNFNLRMNQLETFAEHTGLYDPEPGSIVDCTYGELFKHKSPVDWIKDWVASPGDQGRGSIPSSQLPPPSLPRPASSTDAVFACARTSSHT